ncbi:MAG: peptidoglycan DD-metalloendopeptidase family protein [Ruminococcus sp.]|nr:peptidoglycan DD-metalloendopeptidase family protein [Ruminococcus sp.]
MKNFSGNNKGSKGFYAALGISAVMIGSACYFAYEQGEKLTEDFTARNIPAESEEAVDRHVNDLPKGTAPTYRITSVVSATQTVAVPPVATAPPVETMPAEIILVDPAEPVAVEDEYVPIPVEADEEMPVESVVNTAKLENVKQPLSEMGDVIGVFSNGELIKNPTTGSWQTHNGADIAADVGTEVYAVSNGEITEVNNDPVWGVTVLLNHHNGYETRYCGLSQGLDVQVGDTIVSGDLIGTVGDTADIESSLAPHLHIEMLHNGGYIDPIAELGD